MISVSLKQWSLWTFRVRSQTTHSKTALGSYRDSPRGRVKLIKRVIFTLRSLDVRCKHSSCHLNTLTCLFVASVLSMVIQKYCIYRNTCNLYTGKIAACSREFHFWRSFHVKNLTWNSHEIHVNFTRGDFACVYIQNHAYKLQYILIDLFHAWL